jgi:hypothetical protein
MKRSLLASIFGLAIVGDAVGAVHLNLKGKRRSALDAGALRRRGNINGQASLDNSADISYTVNLTLGGAPFTTMIDTGRLVTMFNSLSAIPDYNLQVLISGWQALCQIATSRE